MSKKDETKFILNYPKDFIDPFSTTEIKSKKKCGLTMWGKMGGERMTREKFMTEAEGQRLSVVTQKRIKAGEKNVFSEAVDGKPPNVPVCVCGRV